MEFKRQKLEAADRPEAGTSFADTNDDDEGDELSSASLISVLGAARSVESSTAAIAVAQRRLYALKKRLSSKERVLAFLERDNRLAFRSLLDHIVAASSSSVAAAAAPTVADQRAALLREAISVVANCCHLSVMACVEVRTRFEGLGRVFCRFLECRQEQAKVPLALHIAVLRLIGNLCELTETASAVARNGPLMEQVVMWLNGESCDNNTKEARQAEELALRVLRLLAKRARFAKYILQVNGCSHVAKFIVRRHQTGEDVFRERADVLQTLHSLLQVYPADVGRQLASCSECIDIFLQFLLDRKDEDDANAKLVGHWTEFILRCIHSSHEIRSQLGRNAIGAMMARHMDKKTLHDTHCRLLCCFLLDVYGRCWMRESGALELILDKFCETTKSVADVPLNRLQLQQAIMADLRSIQHDSESMALTINYPNFMSTAIGHIKHFLEENAEKCQIQYRFRSPAEDQEVHGAEPAVDEEQPKTNRKRPEPCEEQPLCKDFSSSYAPSTSFAYSPASSPPSKSTAAAWSPSMSPSTSAAYGSSPPASPSSAHCQFQLDDYLGDADSLRAEMMSPSVSSTDQMAPEELEADDPSSILDQSLATDQSTENPQQLDDESTYGGGGESQQHQLRARLRRQIVNSCLTLISHFSHQPDERKSVVLLEEEVLTALIRHVSEAPEMDNRLCRALRRLARHQIGLQKLLQMDFHLIVIKHLIRRKCILTRFSLSCARCELRRDFGRRLLADHALLADSAMGEHTLLRLRMDAASGEASERKAEWARLRALAAGLILFRRDELRTRFYRTFQPLEVLLGAMSQLVKETVCDGERRLDTQSEEGQLCCDLLATFSSLIFNHQRILENSSSNGLELMKKYNNNNDNEKEEAAQKSETKCVLEEPKNDEEETLKFSDTRGRLVIEVPKRALCTWNEYFMGMFGSEFVERLSGRDQFMFDADAECCGQEDFVKFLHFSIGCSLQSECTHVCNAECCAALLKLADKYLCTRLLDHLLQGGIARRFITGSTLRLFLPLVLSLPTIADGNGGLKNVCALVLLRFSSDAEALATLRQLGHCDANGALVDALFALLHDFLTPFAALPPTQRVHGHSVSTIPAYWDF